MTKSTHNTGGLLFSLIPIKLLVKYYIVIYSFPYIALLLAIYLYFAVLGASFPDIDLKNSYISKRYPLAWKFFGKKYKHRSFTHSFLALFLLGAFLLFLIFVSLFNEIIIAASLGLFLGYISHIFLDLFNPQGVELFYPFSFNVKIFNIKTKSYKERIFNNLIKLLILFAVIALIMQKKWLL